MRPIGRCLMVLGAAAGLLSVAGARVAASAVPAPSAGGGLRGPGAVGGLRGPEAQAPDPLVALGRQLYATGCQTCHGSGGEGVPGRGPSLLGAGAATADFYLSTGRMPAAQPTSQAPRKPPAYSRAEIDALVAYVASLGAGPAIPRIDPATGDLAAGLELFANNCAPCHSSAGAGGALGHAVVAPNLMHATPLQTAEAVRVGPGAMPRFGPESLDDREVASIVRYVGYLQHPEDRGGAGLGHLGPIPEGFVAWVIGLGTMLVAIRWIGTTD